MTEPEKLKMCTGCRNNFYNGNNDMGVEKCWSLSTAKLVLRKEVPIDQRPPWTQKAKTLLSCYHAAGCVYVEPNREC